MVNVSTMNTIPLITNTMSRMKCQCRATPIVCRPPGSPNNGLSMIASSLAVHTRVLGTGPRNRSHFRVGAAVDLAVQPGVIGEDLPAGPVIPTIKMKFTRCVTMIQPGTPELKVGVDGTHECVRMYDWAGLVPMNSFSATTIAIPATATSRRRPPYGDEARAQPKVHLAEPQPRVRPFLAQQCVPGERAFGGVTVMPALVSHGTPTSAACSC